MKLIIAEKPSLAVSIAGAMDKDYKKEKGYFIAGEYKITWCFGHMLKTKLPSEVDELYKKWDIKNPIFLYDINNPPYKKDASSSKQLTIINKLVKQSKTIINACDPDREGELIFQEILVFSNIKNKEIKRFWCNSLTPSEIIRCLENLKDNQIGLSKASFLRQYGDYIFGLNTTMTLSAKFKENYSVGRVQTPTLYLVVKKDNEIENFKPKDYYQYKINVDDESFICKEKYETKVIVQSIVNNLKTLTISNSTNDKKIYQEKLFSLTTFQKHMSKKYSWSAKKSLQILQSLYEKKLTTYPRTESNYISEKTAEHLNKNITFLTKYFNDVMLQNQKINSKAVGEVGSHEAITPTGIISNTSLVDDEKLGFEVILSRFLSHYMNPAIIIESKKTAVDNLDITYEKTATSIKEANFLVVENTVQSKINTYISDGVYQIDKTEILSKQTTPSKYYDDGSLISKMKNLGNDDSLSSEEKEVLKGKGIGTVATRANIIEELIKREYLFRDKKTLKSTNKGKKMIDLLSQTSATDVKITSLFEMLLLKVETNQIEFSVAKKQFELLTNKVIQEIKNIK